MSETPEALRELLADLCHEQWTGWMRYLFSRGQFATGGAFTIPAEFVRRWQHQMDTPYQKLSKRDQDSDRREADKFMALLDAQPAAVTRAETPAPTLVQLVRDLQVHAHEQGWQDVDDPIAALLDVDLALYAPAAQGQPQAPARRPRHRVCASSRSTPKS